MTLMTNELPFMLELPNGIYKVKTTKRVVDIGINSDMYNLYVARFPEFSGKQKYVGEKDKLQKIITEYNISNYAFDDCKTFVSMRCNSKREFTEDDYLSVTEEQCIEKIRSSMIKSEIRYTNAEIYYEKAKEKFEKSKTEDIDLIKQQILIENEFSDLHIIDAYYEALNIIIRQYSYLRKHFWVNKVDENILNGTLVQDYLDGKSYSAITRAGLGPSILPCKKKFPEITEEEKEELDRNLLSGTTIPVEEELILVARSLWYRLEYRSAIIESSAALEIAVEKKIIQKMILQGKKNAFIEKELKKTETNFYQRCDVFLEKYTGKSFVKNNTTLWNKIDKHRKEYRNKIVHADAMPNKNTTKEIIDDFEKAIQYISDL